MSLKLDLGRPCIQLPMSRTSCHDTMHYHGTRFWSEAAGSTRMGCSQVTTSSITPTRTTDKKRKEMFTFSSDHNESLQRRQPGAGPLAKLATSSRLLDKTHRFLHPTPHACIAVPLAYCFCFSFWSLFLFLLVLLHLLQL